MMEWTSIKSFFQNYLRFVAIGSVQSQCCAVCAWRGAAAGNNEDQEIDANL